MMDRSRRVTAPSKPAGGSTKASGAAADSKPAPFVPTRQRQYATAVAPSKPSIGGAAGFKASVGAKNPFNASRGGSKLPAAGPSLGRSATANANKPPVSSKPPLPGRGARANAAPANTKAAYPTNNHRASAVTDTKRSASAYESEKPAAPLKLKKSQSIAVAVPKTAKTVAKPAIVALDHPILAPKPTKYAAPMEEVLSEATRLKRIKDWRERFLHMKFYFDGIDYAKAYKLKQMVSNLGGVVERFLSFDITHFVTANPLAFDVSRNVDISGVNGPDVMHIAKDLEVSLWTVERLEHVLYCVSEQKTLQDALRNEKTFGINQKKSSNFKVLDELYLLIEEPSGQYKPISVKEYPQVYDREDPSFPIMRFGKHSRQTVFAPKSTMSPEEELSSWNRDQDEDLENVPPEQAELLVGGKLDRNASGFLSGSVAQNAARNVKDNPILAKMISQRAPKNANNKRPRETDVGAGIDEEALEEAARAKRMKQYHVYPMIFQKSGFCENCNVKYDDYSRHIKSVKHRKYATNPANFYNLDYICNKARRIRSHQHESESDESSDKLEIVEVKPDDVSETESSDDDDIGEGHENKENDGDEDMDEDEDDEEEEEDERVYLSSKAAELKVLNEQHSKPVTRTMHKEESAGSSDAGSETDESSDDECPEIANDAQFESKAPETSTEKSRNDDSQKTSTNAVVGDVVMDDDKENKQGQIPESAEEKKLVADTRNDNEPPLYDIEKVEGKKIVDGIPYYCCFWKGYPRSQSTWESYTGKGDPSWSKEDLKFIEEFEERAQKREEARQARLASDMLKQKLKTTTRAVFGLAKSKLTSVIDFEFDDENIAKELKASIQATAIVMDKNDHTFLVPEGPVASGGEVMKKTVASSICLPLDQNTGSILQDSCADHPRLQSTSRITPRPSGTVSRPLVTPSAAQSAPSSRRSSRLSLTGAKKPYNS